jgi:dTDP-4-dehydrorhamnose reductase
MRAIVFGAGGQVGKEVLRCARPAGADAVGVGRSICDLTVPGAAAAIIRAGACDAVFNAAAYTAVDRAETEPDLAAAINIAAPGEMARACAELGIPFVHFSTDYVFDGAASRPYRETDATGPLGVYGRTKLDGEKAVAAAGGASAILRLSWVFSAHGSNFVKTMLRLSSERHRLRVVADQTGKPTPASAAAAAALVVARALAADRSLSGVYHIAGDEPVVWADFARTIFDMAGRGAIVEPITTAEYPTPAKRPLYSVLDTRKFEETFGLAAPSWRDGLGAVLVELGVWQGS